MSRTDLMLKELPLSKKQKRGFWGGIDFFNLGCSNLSLFFLRDPLWRKEVDADNLHSRQISFSIRKRREERGGEGRRDLRWGGGEEEEEEEEEEENENRRFY